MIATVVLLSVFTLTLDQMCVNEMKRFMPIYPDAEIISQEYNFLRPYGIGETVMLLYSADDSRTVGGWYGRHIGMELREGRNLVRNEWSVVRAEDRQGSQIILYGRCVQ
ncbi:MAG: hypothetical protein ACOCYT_00130 [Chloroflexota bacterium]